MAQLTPDPVKTVRTGEGFDVTGDPLAALEKELEVFRYAKLQQLPTFTGEHSIFMHCNPAHVQAERSASSRTMPSRTLSPSRNPPRRLTTPSRASPRHSSWSPRR